MFEILLDFRHFSLITMSDTSTWHKLHLLSEVCVYANVALLLLKLLIIILIIHYSSSSVLFLSFHNHNLNHYYRYYWYHYYTIVGYC